MGTEKLIETRVYCTVHALDFSFITQLEELGLIELQKINEQKFIPFHQLHQLEKITRLYQDLDINVAGLAAILDMLERLEEQRKELNTLKNRLRFYEH